MLGLIRSITLPGGARCTTTASARYLVIGQPPGDDPAVEATTNDRDRALRHRAMLVRQYPSTTWHVIDTAPTTTTERNP